jgi:hypothetical protein
VQVREKELGSLLGMRESLGIVISMIAPFGIGFTVIIEKVYSALAAPKASLSPVSAIVPSDTVPAVLVPKLEVVEIISTSYDVFPLESETAFATVAVKSPIDFVFGGKRIPAEIVIVIVVPAVISDAAF